MYAFAASDEVKTIAAMRIILSAGHNDSRNGKILPRISHSEAPSLNSGSCKHIERPNNTLRLWRSQEVSSYKTKFIDQMVYVIHITHG